MLIPKTANCGTLGDWAKQNGCFIPYTGTGQPGDLVLFDFSGAHKTRQHVGILVSQTGNTLTTIEGNTSVTSNDNGGAVMRRTRTVSQVVGYVRPEWTSAQTAARLIQIAAGQVGVKESPANSNNVKYNAWFYGKAVSGSAYPWCCVFVEWCFAVLCGEIEGGKTVNVSAYLLANGSKGSAVKKLQILLNGLGYSAGTVDGEFGAKTKAAVLKYQKDNGLTADGEVGAKTWSKLIN
jgi:hypothetical protein